MVSMQYDPSRQTMVCLGVCVLIFVYYWTLLSDGRFLLVAPIPFGLTFNSMIEYMSRGRFDVDPSSIGFEGFVRDGRTYAYFGVLPALLRWPLLIWPRFAGVDFTALSCAIAATLAAIAKLATVRQARRVMGDAPYARRVTLFVVAIVIFGGALVQFLRPAIYEEPLHWASAIAAAFVLLAFRWCVDAPGRRAWHLVAMATLAGLCLLTRVSTSIGLYAACGGVMLTTMIAAWRGRRQGASMASAFRAAVVPSLILVAFAVVCGFINYERWGWPLTFMDFRYYNLLPPGDPTLTIVATYGYFNLSRLWFGLSFYFFPIWMIIGSDGHFLFHAAQERLFHVVEPPPATFLASDPFLCFLTCLGLVWLRRARDTATDRLTAWPVAIGLLIPCILILIAIAVVFRYRMEFYPFFEFLALFGLFQLRSHFVVYPRLLTWVCGAMVAVGIVFSHLFLVAYKVEPGFDAFAVEDVGWIAAYREYFREAYPGIYRRIEGVGTPK
jgi:hypothetical protein